MKWFLKFLVSIIGMLESVAIFFITMADIFFGYGTNTFVMVASLITFVLFSRMYDKCVVEE